ncbi:PDPK1 [Symbiodinium sp. CCMP2592]|nr:PDPK1 [Symbiodinium sp. CCMP2592]
MSFPVRAPVRRRDVDFDVGVLLGRGTFTSVYQAVEKATGKRCAMKIVDRYRCERLKKTADVFMEKHCLLRTNHPNIVKMLGWFSDNTCIYVMLEECLGGELWEVIKTVGCPIPQARHCLKQVVNAVEYLRQARIVHRDIKAENIMLTELATVKLIDFGTAKDLENPQIKGSGNASRHKVFEDYVGTPQFMPKEVIENKCSDQRSDIWSFGCTIFQVLSGCPPFHDRSEYLIFQRVLARDLQFPPGIDPTAKDLIERMVVQDPDSRLGALDLEDLKAHPFFDGHTFEKAHLLPVPVPSLAALCYQRLGSRMEQFLEPLAAWEGAAQLAPAVREQLERMKVAHRWQEEVLPPPDEF